MKKGTKSALLLIETLNRGGIENVLLRLLPKLKHEGWHGVVVTVRDGGEMLPEYRAAGIDVVALNQAYFLSPKTLMLIYRQVVTLEPDLVMTNLFKADLIGRIFLRFVARRPVVPYLVTTYNHPRYWIARVFEVITKPLATRYIANSEAVQTFYESRLGVRQGKIVVAPNGVDIDTFEAANGNAVIKELSLPKRAFVVTCVANLAPNKGQSDLLAAFETVFGDNPKAFLLLVGGGEEHDVLDAQRQNLKTKDRIFLLGRRTDVPSILKITDVFALATLFEGMSTALLEAMAAQKAIVTTDIPENKVLLTHDKTALLVKPKDRTGLAHALQAMHDSQSLRERLSLAANDYVEQNFSITQMAQTFAKTFDQVCGVYPKHSIVHVIGSLESGGAENMLLRTLPLLNQGDCQEVVVTLFRPGELAAVFRKKGITVTNIGMQSFFDLGGLRRLDKVVKSYKPGLVVTYLFHASLIGRLFLQRKVNIPVVPFLRSTYNFSRYLPARLFEVLTKSLVSHYFANSEAVKDYYVKNIGVASDKITVIPNGIDTSLYDRIINPKLIRELKLPDDRLVITCVANLAVNKGHSVLLEAFERVFRTYSSAYLLIVGEGQERPTLEKQIRHYQSRSQILFLGRRDDVPSILAISDIFALPTLFEGLSNAILEAMAAGCAVVTTSIPENRVMIKHNRTGLLVPTQNSQKLERAIMELIANRDKRNKIGRSGEKFVKDHFDLETIAKQLDNAFKLFVHG